MKSESPRADMTFSTVLSVVAAEMVEGGVARDAVEPCRELVLGIVGGDLTESFLEAFQTDVLHVFLLGDIA